MIKKCVITTMLMVLLAVPLLAEDLYKVTVINNDNAEALSELGIDPFLRLNNGYLILAKEGHRAAFEKSDLEYHFIASGVERDHLALDISRDGSLAGKFQVIFEEEGIRLLKVEPNDFSQNELYTGLARVQTENLRIIYKEPRQKWQNTFENGLYQPICQT